MKYRIALVEYLNTWPFSTGIKLSDLESQFEIIHATPAQCAQLFVEGKVDVSLCPVGALSELPAHIIQGQYCIGADGPVETVVLLSKVPLNEITLVRLDDHSRTSNQLVKILAQKHWKKEWTYYHRNNNGSAQSCLMIGDKVFDQKENYPYQYDLSTAWKQFTGLPMVFAVWVTSPKVPDHVMHALDDACALGLDMLKNKETGLATWQAKYLTNKISYPLDDQKKDAMRRFLVFSEMIMEAQPQK